MYGFVGKAGSSVIPTSPRSPTAWVWTVSAGEAESLPFRMTRTCPVCWRTNNRPSGAAAMPLGMASPRATTVWTKPRGRTGIRRRPSIPSTTGRKRFRPSRDHFIELPNRRVKLRRRGMCVCSSEANPVAFCQIAHLNHQLSDGKAVMTGVLESLHGNLSSGRQIEYLEQPAHDRGPDAVGRELDEAIEPVASFAEARG